MKKIENKEVINLQWHITNRCNKRCKHCYHTTYEGDEPTLDDLKKIFRSFLNLAKSKNKIPRIVITGGEPFIRTDFMDLLEYMSKFKNEIESCYILTNGSLLTDKLIKKIKKNAPVVDGMQISIEGDEKMNDIIRGRGSFKKILETLSILKDNSMPVHLAVTVSKENYKNIFNLLDLLLIYDVSLYLRRFVPIGFGGGNITEGVLSSAETRGFFKKVNDINKKHKLSNGGEVFSTRRVCSGSIQAIDWPEKVLMSCGVKKKALLVIMPEKDVYVCRLVPFSIGNLKNHSLEYIYDNGYNDFMKKWKIDKRCKSCESFEKCNGGASCISLAMTGNFLAKDPQCWKK